MVVCQFLDGSVRPNSEFMEKLVTTLALAMRICVKMALSLLLKAAFSRKKGTFWL